MKLAEIMTKWDFYNKEKVIYTTKQHELMGAKILKLIEERDEMIKREAYQEGFIKGSRITANTIDVAMGLLNKSAKQ